jgi:hypothetical protein
MTASLTHEPDIPEDPAIAELRAEVASLAAKLEQYRRQAATIRSFEDIWASTYPGYLASTPRSRAALSLVTDQSVAILEAARS